MEDTSANANLAGVTEALQGCRLVCISPITLDSFRGFPGQSLDEWLEEVDIYCKQLQISETQKVDVIVSHLDGQARQEIRCHPDIKDTSGVIGVLKKYFGGKQTVCTLPSASVL